MLILYKNEKSIYKIDLLEYAKKQKRNSPTPKLFLFYFIVRRIIRRNANEADFREYILFLFHNLLHLE